MVASALFFSYTTFCDQLNRTYSSLRNLTAQGARKLEVSVNSLSNAAYAVASNDLLRQWINHREPSQAFFSSASDLSSLVRDLQKSLLFSDPWTNQFIESAVLFINGNRLEIRMSSSHVNMQQAYEAFQNAIENDLSSGFFLSTAEEPQAMYFKRFQNITFQESFVIVFLLNSEAFIQNAVPYIEDYAYDVSDSRGIILFSTVPQHVGTQQTLETSQGKPVSGQADIYRIERDTDTYLFSVERIRQESIALVFSTPFSVIIQPIWRNIRHYLLFFLINLTIWLIVAMSMVTTYTRAFSDIAERLDNIRHENYHVEMPHYDDRELNIISEAFNHMANEVETLINKGI